MKWLDNLTGWWQSGWDAIIDWVVELLNKFESGLATFITDWLVSQGLTLELPVDVFNVLDEISYGIGYILPLKDLTPLFLFWLSFHFVNLIFAIFRMIHSTIIKRVSVKV